MIMSAVNFGGHYCLTIFLLVSLMGSNILDHWASIVHMQVPTDLESHGKPGKKWSEIVSESQGTFVISSKIQGKSRNFFF